MNQRSFLRRVATLVAGALLLAQLAVAAYACPLMPGANGTADRTGAVATQAGAMPGCDEPMGAMDSASPNLCAEHCKQGHQSERAQVSLTVPPALLNALYATPAVPEPVHPPLAEAWRSALVAASPPHALAHCVLRI